VCHLEATDPQLIRKYAEDLKNKRHQKETILQRPSIKTAAERT